MYRTNIFGLSALVCGNLCEIALRLYLAQVSTIEVQDSGEDTRSIIIIKDVLSLLWDSINKACFDISILWRNEPGL